MNYNQIQMMKIPKNLPKLLSREEVHALIDSCSNKKHRALMLLPYGSGLRYCRTSKLGAHVGTCDECGFEKISYNSCRNRHCPKCQTLAKEQWIEKQNQYLMNASYFHIVFTLPEELNSLMLNNQKTAYGLFFKAVAETLLELCADGKYLGAKPGITAHCHRWRPD